jgi:hypothetical protein
MFSTEEEEKPSGLLWDACRDLRIFGCCCGRRNVLTKIFYKIKKRKDVFSPRIRKFI